MSDSTTVDRLPLCDFPHVTPTAAAFDAATKLGPWASMCADHFAVYGIGLGLGVGQRLVLKGT